MNETASSSIRPAETRLIGAICVLFVLAFLFMQSQELPYDDADDTGKTLIAFLDHHTTDAKGEVIGVALVVAIWALLFPLLWRLLRAAERVRGTGWHAVALSGGAGVVAAVSVAVAIQRALVLGAGDADASPGAYMLAQHVSDGLFVLATLMTGWFLLGAGLVIVRSRPVAKWLGVLALIGAAANLVGAALGLTSNGEEGVAGLLMFVGQISWLLFVLVLGVLLLRGRFAVAV